MDDDKFPRPEEFWAARDEHILKLLAGGMTQTQVAARCGLTQQAVSKAAERARRRAGVAA